MENQFQLRELDFTDRVLVSLSVAPDLSSIALETEACLPQGPEGKLTQIGHIKVSLDNISKADIHVKPGFHQDMSLAYSVKGEDMRGNEVYELTDDDVPPGGRLVRLRSDLLDLVVVCGSVLVTVLATK